MRARGRVGPWAVARGGGGGGSPAWPVAAVAGGRGVEARRRGVGSLGLTVSRWTCNP
jgi:hypothetical protein